MVKWLICGMGESINDIKDKFPSLFKTHKSIGLNRFFRHYPQVEYICFADEHIFNKGEGVKSHHKLIVSEVRDSELKMRNVGKRYWIGNYIVKPHYLFKQSPKPVWNESGSLCLCRSIVTSAINYAYLQGADEIVLAGIDLTPDWKYFNGHQYRPKSPEHIKEIKEIIYKFAEKIPIYKLSDEQDIEIPKALF